MNHYSVISQRAIPLIEQFYSLFLRFLKEPINFLDIFRDFSDLDFQLLISIWPCAALQIH